MSFDWLSTILGAAGVVMSTGVSYFVARHTAAKELEKLRLIWEREDDKAFGAMVAAVIVFCGNPNLRTVQSCQLSIGPVRAKAEGEFAAALDELIALIQVDIRDTTRVNRALQQVIAEHRKHGRS